MDREQYRTEHRKLTVDVIDAIDRMRQYERMRLAQLYAVVDAAKVLLKDSIKPIRLQDGLEECAFCGRPVETESPPWPWKVCGDDECPSTPLRAAIEKAEATT